MRRRHDWALGLVVSAVGLAAFQQNSAAQQAQAPQAAPLLTQNQQQQDPSAIPASYRAMVLGKDPAAGVVFEKCVIDAQIQPVRTEGLDPKKAALQGLGSAIGAAAGSAAIDGGKSITGQSMLGSSMAGLNGAAQSCEDPLPNLKYGTACDDYKTSSEKSAKFDPIKLREAISETERVQALASCKLTNANKAKKISTCFETETESLRLALKAVKEEFDAQMQQQRNYENQVNALIEKQDQKMRTLEGKMESLNKTISKVDGVLRRANGATSGEGDTNSIAGVKRRLADYKARLVGFERTKAVEPVRRAAQCFRDSGAIEGSTLRSRCVKPGGGFYKPVECMLASYEAQEIRRLKGNNWRPTEGDRPIVSQKMATFRSAIEEALTAFEGPNPRATSVENAKRFIHSKLDSFGPYANYIINELKACEADAKKQIAAELANPTDSSGSELGRTKYAMEQLGGQVSSELAGMLFGSAKDENDIGLVRAMREAGREVFGDDLKERLDGFGCNTKAVISNNRAGGTAPGQVLFTQVDLDTQVGCIEGLRANLMALMDGTIPPGASAPMQLPLSVPGQGGVSATCQGLTNCLTVAGKLRSEAQSLRENLVGNGTFSGAGICSAPTCPGLRKFHRETNQNIQTAIKGAKESFARRIGVFRNQFATYKFMLAKANVDFPELKDNNVKIDEVCPIKEDAICELPGDFDRVIGGLGGMPNIANADFKEVKKSAEQEASNANKTDGDLRTMLTGIRRLAEVCKKEDESKGIEKKLSKARNELEDYLESCRAQAEVGKPADEGFGSNLDDLAEDLKRTCENAGSTNENCDLLRRKVRKADRDCNQIINIATKNKEEARWMRCAMIPDEKAKKECMAGKIGSEANSAK